MALGFGGGTIVGAARVRLEVDRSRFDKDWRRSETDVSRGAERMGRALKVGLAVGIGATVAGLYALQKAGRAAFGELKQDLKVGAQTAAVIKSTGHEANVSVKHVDRLANSLLRKTGIDDEVVKSGENMLLTFTRIRNEQGKGNDIFDQSTKVLLDMSTVLGTDASKSAIQLGKALQDPERGITALRRVGVAFTKDQQEMITRWVEHGQIVRAQKFILAELNKEFGGSAEALGQTLPGKINIFRESLRNMGADLLKHAQPAFERLVDYGNKTFLPALDRFGRFVDRIFRQRTFRGRIRIAWQGLDRLGDDLWKRLQTTLFGSAQRRPLKLKSGKIIEWDAADPGLVDKLGDALVNADWARIGARVGAGISGGITFTVDLVERFVTFIRDNREKMAAAASDLIEVLAHGFEERAGVVAEAGAVVITRVVATLLDPVFWARHLDLLAIIIVSRFPVARLTGALGRIFGRVFGDVFLSLVGRLPALVQDFALRLGVAFTRYVPSAFSWLLDRVPRFLKRAFSLGFLFAFVDGFKRVIDRLGEWLKIRGLELALKFIEPFSHLPWKLGEKARDAKNRINEELAKIHDRDVDVTVRFRGQGARVTISGPGGSQTITIEAAATRFIQGVFAQGGRIPGAPVARDSVLAMLSPGEFVVTGGGERLLESMTFPGVLNWLQRAQPRHFQAGGYVEYQRAVSKQEIAGLARQLPPAVRAVLAVLGAGVTSTHGLVPQVLRALSWARSHGWHGLVTSGFRTHEQQAALYARYLAGGPLAAAPYHSSHEYGQAVDVSDYYTFGATMRSAPANSRLYNRLGAIDPVHYSITGYQTGGRVAVGPLLPYWLPRDFGIRRRKGETHRAFLRRVHQLDVGSPPVRIQTAIARARLTPSTVDDISAATRALNWFRRGRGASWLSSRQRLSVLEALGSARDELQSLRGEADTETAADQVLPTFEALRRIFAEFGSNIGTSSSMLINAGVGTGSAPLGTPTRVPVSSGGVTTWQSAARRAAGRGSVTVNQHFTKPPEDPTPLMRSAQFAADAAFS